MAAATGPALYPGASTFPGASVYPGQGSLPIVRAYVSTDDFSDSTPTYTDYTSRMRSWSVARGGNLEFGEFDAGTASVVFDDRDRALDPAVNSAIRPRNRLWIFEEFSGEVQSLFVGYANAWQHTYDESGIVDATATITAADELSVLSLQSLDIFSVWLSSAQASIQMALTLDAVSNHAPRSLTFSVALNAARPAASTVESAVQAISDVVQSNALGAFFVAKDGTLVYETASSSNMATFGDAGGAELPYLAYVTDYSDALLYNDVRVTRDGGAEQQRTDATSIAAYGVRLFSLTGVRCDADIDAQTIAANIRDAHKDPAVRITSISPNMNDGETARVTFSLELNDKITVKQTPPGGGARVSQSLRINRIELSGTPAAPPSCTLGLSPFVGIRGGPL